MLLISLQVTLAITAQTLHFLPKCKQRQMAHSSLKLNQLKGNKGNHYFTNTYYTFEGTFTQEQRQVRYNLHLMTLDPDDIYVLT